MDLEIRRAEELVDAELEARWATRREARQGGVLRSILRTFAERGGPIPVDDVRRAFADWPPAQVDEQLRALDANDLILLEEEEIRLAYPFSAVPTPFLVRFDDGRERYACCAIDALGMAAMLQARIRVQSRCHDCGELLELRADRSGPLGGDGVMVWIGTRGAGERRVATSL